MKYAIFAAGFVAGVASTVGVIYAFLWGAGKDGADRNARRRRP